MIMIYDFDGTLTPFGIPQYEILKKFGYDDEKLLKRVMDLMKKEGLSLYRAFYKTYEEILKENNTDMNYSNILLGVKDVVFNPGVLSYFEEMQEKNSGIKHFIVTSGLEEYVCNTEVCNLVDGIYGVTYHREGDIFTTIDRLVTDEEKPKIIEKIIENNKDKKVVYIGDGLTDKYAFEFVHSLGGICIYVGTTEQDFEGYKSLKESGIVDECFSRDFSEGSDFKRFVKCLLEYKKI